MMPVWASAATRPLARRGPAASPCPLAGGPTASDVPHIVPMEAASGLAAEIVVRPAGVASFAWTIGYHGACG